MREPDETTGASEFKFLDPGPPIDDAAEILAAAQRAARACQSHLRDLKRRTPAAPAIPKFACSGTCRNRAWRPFRARRRLSRNKEKARR